MNIRDQHTVPFELIAKYLVNEVNDAERQQVMDWILENEDEFEKILQSWEKAEEALKAPRLDIDAAWGKVHKQTIGQEAPKYIKSRWLRPQIMRIAAAILLLFGIGWVIFNVIAPNDFVNLEVAEALQDTTSVKLADGSLIVLNKETQLTYPKEFSENKREVKLSGEAFFEITHDKEKPFVVLTDEIQIRVLGTSFNVDSRENLDSITVTVETGTVEVSVLNNGGIAQRDTLRTNSQIKYVKSSKDLLDKERPAPDYSMWNKGELRYHIVSIQKLAEIFETYYNVKIDVDPSIQDCEMRPAFFNPNQETIVEAFDKTSGLGEYFKYEKMDKEGKVYKFLPSKISCE